VAALVVLVVMVALVGLEAALVVEAEHFRGVRLLQGKVTQVAVTAVIPTNSLQAVVVVRVLLVNQRLVALHRGLVVLVLTLIHLGHL
jgi:hypothetical protein